MFNSLTVFFTPGVTFHAWREFFFSTCTHAKVPSWPNAMLRGHPHGARRRAGCDFGMCRTGQGHVHALVALGHEPQNFFHATCMLADLGHPHSFWGSKPFSHACRINLSRRPPSLRPRRAAPSSPSASSSSRPPPPPSTSGASRPGRPAQEDVL